jgi:hypothetical protein
VREPTEAFFKHDVDAFIEMVGDWRAWPQYRRWFVFHGRNCWRELML